jgi:hypothetical protein
VELLQPADRHTGSNSVGVREEVAFAGPGQSLCLRDVAVPDGTARVRVAASWQGPRRPALELVLVTPDRVRRGEAPAADAAAVPPATARVDVPVPVVETGREVVPARLCVTPRGGTVAFGGVRGVQGDQRPVLLGGEELEVRVAVWFLAEERASLLASVPDALGRAARFRPDPVGPWIYVVLLLVAMPLTWLVALRLLATRAAGEARGARTALAIGAVGLLNAVTFALITPPWQGPDEPDHFAFVQRLAETGEVPSKDESEPPVLSSQHSIAVDVTRAFSQVGLVEARPPWFEYDERRWRQRLARSRARADDGAGFLFAASPHGPGYYGLMVPAYAVAGESTFAQLLAARLLTALLAGLAAAFAFLTVRELAPRHEWLAAAAGLLVAFQPQFAFMGGVVNNDTGVNTAAALLLFLLMRGLRRGLTVPLGLGIAAALVAVHVTKGTGTALWPAAGVAVAGMLWRRHSRADAPGYVALAGGAAAIQGLWALLTAAVGSKPFTTSGGAAEEGLTGMVERLLEQLSGYASYTWQFFLFRLPFMTDLHVQGWPAYDVYIQGGWAAFGWLTVRFPSWVYVVICAVSLLAAALCAVAVWRERAAARDRGWELATLLVALAGVLAGVAAVYFTTEVRSVPAEQGRYVFTAIVPLAAIAVGGTLAFGRRLAPVLAAALVAAVMGLDYASQYLLLESFFT